MSYTYKYPRPAVTVDAIIFSNINNKLHVLLIQRLNPPFQNQWAFPGGFVEMDEELHDAALRELMEETGLEMPGLVQLHTVGTIGRDPRGRTVTIFYYGFTQDTQKIKAGDDAKNAQWYAVDNIPDMAFDHNKILELAIKKLV